MELKGFLGKRIIDFARMKDKFAIILENDTALKFDKDPEIEKLNLRKNRVEEIKDTNFEEIRDWVELVRKQSKGTMYGLYGKIQVWILRVWSGFTLIFIGIAIYFLIKYWAVIKSSLI